MPAKKTAKKVSKKAASKSAKKVAKKVAKKAARKSAKKVAKKAARKSAKKVPGKAEVSAQARHEMIEQAAYYLAEKRGFQGGDPLADWLTCEEEINVLLSEKGTQTGVADA